MGVPRDAIDRIVKPRAIQGSKKDLRVGALLRYSHAWFVTLGSMGICPRGQINRFYNAATCAELYEAVTGIPTDLSTLRERVDRIWTLFRIANLREELIPKNDEVAPKQWFDKGGFRNYLTGEPLKRSETSSMIKDYYNEWGWDPETGIPPRQELERLGLIEP